MSTPIKKAGMRCSSCKKAMANCGCGKKAGKGVWMQSKKPARSKGSVGGLMN